MVKNVFKIVIPLSGGKSAQVDKDIPNLAGMKIGDKFDGSMLGLNGYTLQITGGSDKEGFPMRRDLSGTARTRALLVGGVGCRHRGKGVRRSKTIRGNRIGEDIVQVNVKILQKGPKPVEELLSLKTEDKPKEGETPKEAPKTEAKPEEKKEEAKPVEPVKEEKKPEEAPKPEPKEEKPAEKVEKETESPKEPVKEEKKEPKEAEPVKTEPEKKETKPEEPEPKETEQKPAEKPEETKPKPGEKKD